MEKVYARLCEKGLKNIDNVPSELVEQVKKTIEEDGYIINEDGTCEKKS